MALPAIVQTATGTDTTFASSVTATFGSPTTAGNLILLAWEGDTGAANAANTPTDTAGNKYTRLVSISNAGVFDLEIWAAWNCKAQASNAVTVTDTIGGSDGIVIIQEWSGLSTVQTLDGNNSATGNSTALSSGAFSIGSTTALIFVAGTAAVGSNNLSLSGSYTNLTQASTSFSNLGICSLVTTNNGTYTGTLTSGSASWACGAVGIRPGAMAIEQIKVPTGMSTSGAVY